jgi:6-phosphogluconolactonase (cycloisomerase 2 family)
VYVASFTDDAIVRFNRDPATGALTPAGCIDDNDSGADACATSTDGLDQPRSVAVSLDGRSVYVAAQVDDAVVRFNRDTNTGALTPAGCIDDLPGEGPDGCATSTAGLNGTVGVEVSPDGKSVYASGDGDDAIVRFDRAPDGALTPAGCIDDNDFGADTCAASTDGLGGATATITTLDNRSLYAVSFGDDAIVRFIRDPATGALTPAGCIQDNDSGSDTCAADTDGLTNAVNVDVSSDGRSVYVAANSDSAVARFNRDPATGAITAAGCIDDDLGGPDTCAGSAPGLDGIFDVHVSFGGSTVYTAAQAASAVAQFNRAADGALTAAGCIDDNDSGPDSCAPSTDGLGGATWLASTFDGRSLYVGTGGDHAIVRLNREAGACGDGLDNDGDGKVDFGADPGCSSGDDQDETDPAPPVDPEAGCLNVDAKVKGKKLGPAQLGRKQKAQRARFKGATRTSRKGIDAYCARGGGQFRIGYPTKRLNKGRPKGLKKKIKGRVVLALASSSRFAVKGVKPGDGAKKGRKKMKKARKLKIGKNTWYVLKKGKVALLVKIRGKSVGEVGIGDARLTTDAKAARRFLTAWKLG